MSHLAQIKSINKTDIYEGALTFAIQKNEYKAFFFGEEFILNETVEIEINHIESPLEWEIIFGKNRNHEQKIVKAYDSEWSYYGYGKIVSINPIIADFGDIQLHLGNWTNDPKVIGEFIYWKIVRLEIKRETAMAIDEDEIAKEASPKTKGKIVPVSTQLVISIYWIVLNLYGYFDPKDLLYIFPPPPDWVYLTHVGLGLIGVSLSFLLIFNKITARENLLYFSILLIATAAFFFLA